MRFNYAKNVEIVTSLEIGDEVTTAFNRGRENEIHVIEDIVLKPSCESAIMVKISGYKNYLDSNWITKKEDK